VLDLTKYSKRQIIALERLETKGPREPMLSRDPLTRETKVVQGFRVVSGLTVDDDEPMVWRAWIGIIDPKDAIIVGGTDDYFVPTRMWGTIPWAGELAEMWLREILKLPRNVEKIYQAEYPKGRPTTFHRMIRLDDVERMYVEAIHKKLADKAIQTKDPGWNLLPGEVAPEPDLPE
jgi:hypothetical protein